ncbi:MAG: hypothetical protein HC908_18340 [Calothrix sp. SM1_7_51]|nr:hypothetical protein [Calothrix sp. SM1_7_51]
MSQLFSDITTITPVAGLGPVVSGNSANLAEFPSTSGLSFVAKDGSIGQIQSGSFGTLGFGNIWSALGLSPFPPGAVASRPYGLRLQRNTDFALLQLEERNPGDGTSDDVDAVIAWGDNTNDRLRFKFVDPQNAVTEVMALLANGNVGIGAINPQARLDVRNSAFLAARFVNTAQTMVIEPFW